MATPKKRAPSSESTPTFAAANASSNAPKNASGKVACQPFPWLVAAVPSTATARFATRNLEVRRREISDRASLLRRLGYSKDQVLSRLSGYQSWEYEPFHTSPLASEVAALVDAVFAPAKGRVTTLQP